MAFAQSRTHDRTLAEINITPLIDVMLVLLVIFMIAAPVLTKDIPLTLPQVAPILDRLPPPPIELRIDAVGEVTVSGAPVAMSELASVLRTERERLAGQKVILSVEASYDVDYEVVAKVLATAQNAGMSNIRMR
ncbi:ExbD/TolR family protein [Lysobacter brunescens]|uniref:ExbD/TolR family protein n=1 Tax=Lysobacter brunescens TaxID=262323 RepID=A0ABW2Y9H0_9GAMM